MLAIIGGSGLSQLGNLEIKLRKVARTPYGEPSGPLTFGRVGGRDVVFLARHGYGHTVAPHEVNYRANLWALKQEGVAGVVSVASVGGIRKDLGPGTLMLPDQIIDYTWGRGSTFFEGADAPVTHIDFTQPYSPVLRQRIRDAARLCGERLAEGGSNWGSYYQAGPVVCAGDIAAGYKKLVAFLSPRQPVLNNLLQEAFFHGLKARFGYTRGVDKAG